MFYLLHIFHIIYDICVYNYISPESLKWRWTIPLIRKSVNVLDNLSSECLSNIIGKDLVKGYSRNNIYESGGRPFLTPSPWPTI